LVLLGVSMPCPPRLHGVENAGALGPQPCSFGPSDMLYKCAATVGWQVPKPPPTGRPLRRPRIVGCTSVCLAAAVLAIAMALHLAGATTVVQGLRGGTSAASPSISPSPSASASAATSGNPSGSGSGTPSPSPSGSSSRGSESPSASPSPSSAASPSVTRSPSGTPSPTHTAIPGVDVWGQPGRDAQHTRRSPLQAPAGVCLCLHPGSLGRESAR
jgi:hypothetical protein